MNNNELLNTLMGALQNPDYKDKISGIFDSFSGEKKEENASVSAPPAPVNASSSQDFLNPEMIVKIKSMLDNFNRTDDNRIGLLNSIKPYMKSGRVKNIDMEIRFIQLINFASGFNKN